jgi:hypothetical protein
MTDAHDAHEISPEDYKQVLGKVREAVGGAIPADATVLVVSRGDEELLELDGRTAWHFPRGQDGKYSGYHPKDSDAALAHLDEWRIRGAQYLVLPATGFWWLDFYGDFASTLRRGHGVVFEDDSCIIFRLGGELLSTAAFETAERVAPHVTELVERLLPDDARVAVVSSGHERLVQLGSRAVVDFPPMLTNGDSDLHGIGAEIAALERMREDGVEYLVVPHISPSWLDLHPNFVGEVERRFPCVARRRNVGLVFALAGAGSPTDETGGGQRLRHGLMSRLADWLAGGNRHAPQS